MRSLPPSTAEADGNAHSPLGPSGSKRWMSCPGSVGFILKHRSEIPKDTGSAYALEGSEAHEFAQRLFNAKGGKVVRPQNTEMVACIEEGYVPFVQERAKRLGLKRVPNEVCVQLFYDRSQKGTCDVPLLGEHAADIIDLKYGAGISVEAKFNTQLAIYAESVIREKAPHYKKSTPLCLIIYQPRAQDNRFVRKWELTRGELAEFCEPIRKTAHAIIMDPDDQPFKADAETTCRFCAAKAFCSHYAAHLLEEMPPTVERSLATVESRLNLPAPKKLNDGQLIRLLRARDDLIAWFADIEKYVTARMVHGHKYDGLKVVEAKTNRKWSDEKEAARVLKRIFPREELYSESFLSPAQAGELIKALKHKPEPALLRLVDKLIVKPEGQPRLTTKEDPRPPLELDPLAELRNDIL